MNITRVHQIELSSVCNLKCQYCPHPKMERAKSHMTAKVFEKAIDWAAELKGPELSFTGMGEALLHPAFPMMIRIARLRLPHMRFLLATNGIALMRPGWEELIAAIVDTDCEVYVSTHRPEIAGRAVVRLAKAGAKVGTNTQFVTSGFDWAGQVEWENLAPRTECQYIKQGWATILQDGTIVNCCMDASGLHPIGNVNDDLDNLPERIDPIPLCASCHLTVPKG